MKELIILLIANKTIAQAEIAEFHHAQILVDFYYPSWISWPFELHPIDQFYFSSKIIIYCFSTNKFTIIVFTCRRKLVRLEPLNLRGENVQLKGERKYSYIEVTVDWKLIWTNYIVMARRTFEKNEDWKQKWYIGHTIWC